MPKLSSLSIEDEILLFSLLDSTNGGNFVSSDDLWRRISKEMEVRSGTDGIGSRHYDATDLKSYWNDYLGARYWRIRQAAQFPNQSYTASVILPPFRLVEEQAKNLNIQLDGNELKPLQTGLGSVQPSGKALDQVSKATGPPKNFEDARNSKYKGKGQKKGKGKD